MFEELVGGIGLGLLILFGIIVIAVIGIAISGGFKRKWYKVYLGNNDVISVYKTWSDRLWQSDKALFSFYHLENGKRVRISTHFTLKIEEL